jgi:hypothetical protein
MAKPATSRIPTAAQVLARQKEDAERDRQQKAAIPPKPAPVANPPPPGREVAASSHAAPPASTKSTAVTVPGERSAAAEYWDAVAVTGIVGRPVKFDGKAGGYVTRDDGEPLPEGAEYVAMCDQVRAGYMRFNGEGEPPDRISGLPYEGWRLPPKEDLPDRDESQWPPGLSGAPADPWQHFIDLPLQQVGTAEMYTFQTASVTGRRAVGNLGKHFDRMAKLHPDSYPVVRLRVGGYQDKRFGWVHTPVFVAVGRVARDGVVTPPDTTPGGDMDDQIPF